MAQSLIVPEPVSQSRFSPSSKEFSSRFSNWSYHDFSIFRVLGRQENAKHEETIREDVEPDEKGWEEHPRNPKRWSAWRKALHMIVLISIALISTLCSTAITSTTQKIHTDLSGGRILDTLPFSLYILGLGVGSLTGTACSELFGRRPSLLVNIPIFALMQLGAGLSRTIVLLICFRFFAGLFAGTCSLVAYHTVLDLYKNSRKTAPTVAFFGAALIGPAFGPVLGVVIADMASWRWVQLSSTLVLVPVLVATFFMKETCERCIRNDLPRLRPGLAARAGLFFEHIFTRPVVSLFKQPTMLALGFTVGFAMAVQYSMAAALPSILAQTYGLSPLSSTVCYLGQAIGILVGSIIYLLQHSNIYCSIVSYWKTAHIAISPQTKSTRFPPRYRLLLALPVTLALPLSLVFFAFTVLPGYSIFIPLSFLSLFGACLFILFVSAFLYLYDRIDGEKRATGLATFLFLVNSVGAGLPIGFDHVLRRLGLKGTFGVLSAGTVLSAAVVWTVWIRGKRKGSK